VRLLRRHVASLGWYAKCCTSIGDRTRALDADGLDAHGDEPDILSRSRTIPPRATRTRMAEHHHHYEGDPTMAEAGTLHDAFIDELRDTYDAERQLTKALPKLAKAAASPDLRAAFETHLEETKGQIERLEEVFESLDEKVQGKHCDGIAGIIEEGKSIMDEDFDDTTMDACLIAAGQRAEHYEMAAYGTLVAWARAMGHAEAAVLLQQTLDEEKAADEKLSSLAEGGINQEAAESAHPDDDKGEPQKRAATVKRGTVSPSKRSRRR
jgi:ferritin-like metal-binding protein YciE